MNFPTLNNLLKLNSIKYDFYEYDTIKIKVIGSYVINDVIIINDIPLLDIKYIIVFNHRETIKGNNIKLLGLNNNKEKIVLIDINKIKNIKFN